MVIVLLYQEAFCTGIAKAQRRPRHRRKQGTASYMLSSGTPAVQLDPEVQSIGAGLLFSGLLNAELEHRTATAMRVSTNLYIRACKETVLRPAEFS